jgi:hypothetical protein
MQINLHRVKEIILGKEEGGESYTCRKVEIINVEYDVESRQDVELTTTLILFNRDDEGMKITLA